MINTQSFVISLGGSLIVPEEIDTFFLKKFRQIILNNLSFDKNFYIIAGGGKTARKYQQAAREITELTREDLDWLGIHSTHLNAHLIRTIFRDVAYPKIITHIRAKENINEKIVVGAGWRPGWSTDFIAVHFAKNYTIDTVINLSNIDFVYDQDPSKFKDAKPVKEISWPNYRKIVGETWDPGLNVPFDPIASKLAHENGVKVVVMNGNNLNNFNNYLNGEKFIGTVIN